MKRRRQRTIWSIRGHVPDRERETETERGGRKRQSQRERERQRGKPVEWRLGPRLNIEAHKNTITRTHPR